MSNENMNLVESNADGSEKQEGWIRVFANALTAALGIAMAVVIVGAVLVPAWLAWKDGNYMWLAFYPVALILLILCAPRK